MLPLTSIPPELATALLEAGGPTALAVGVLWWRLNRLEDRFSSRLEDLKADVDQTEALVYEQIVGADVQEDVDDAPTHPLHDPELEPEEHRAQGRSTGD